MIIHELLKPEDVPFGGEESLTDTARFFGPNGKHGHPRRFNPTAVYKVVQKKGLFHSHGDTPTAGCLAENPNLKWMITGGTPMT